MIELRHKGFGLGLLPEAGGSVAWFRKDGVDILRPAAAPFSAAADRLNIAAFPLPAKAACHPWPKPAGRPEGGAYFAERCDAPVPA